MTPLQSDQSHGEMPAGGDPRRSVLDVVSCGVGFPDLADDAARMDKSLAGSLTEILARADVVFGSRALLAAYGRSSLAVTGLGASGRPERRVIGAAARQDAADALALFRQGRRVAVLASGDALYHGFGGTLAALSRDLDPDERARIRFWPNITAFQALFHRLGLPWEGARLFSAHAEGRLALRQMAEASLAVIYGGSSRPAHVLAAELCAFHAPAGRRPAISADRLGTPEERIARGRVEDLAGVVMSPTSFLVVLPGDEDASPVLALGLPEEAYERERNLITASDARAVILSRLRLPAWGVLWDVGAGSGSVGIEAAALRPGLRVIALERDPARAAMIERNATRLGVANHEALAGEVPAALSGLPAPDRVFVGGGGRELPAVLDACFAALRPGGLLLASAVTLESVHTLHGWRPEQRIGLLSLDIATEQPLAGSYHHLRPQRRLTLYIYSRFTE